jgi:hypothetical protein
MTVGKSHRTPAKHALMNALYGKEVGVALYSPRIERLEWFDLTAADASVDETAVDYSNRQLEWHRDCSPGIQAYHGAQSRTPVNIHLHEIQDVTYAQLVSNLDYRAPRYGWQSLEWAAGNGGGRYYQTGAGAVLVALNGNGADVRLDGVDSRTAVLVNNDPNSVHTWAMRPAFRAELADLTPWCRIISTLGCNASGLQKLWATHPEECEQWYHRIQEQVEGLPRHHDLFLAAIERDAHKWAYLIEESQRENWKTDLKRVAVTAFRKQRLGLETIWYREQPQAFWEMVDRLLRPRRLRHA